MSLITTWHPTYAIFRQPYEWGAFSGDLGRFSRVIKGTTYPKPKEYITNPTVGQIEAMFRSAPRIATDIETAPEHPDRPWTGKDPTRAKLKAIGLGNTEWGLALDCRKNHIRERDAIRKGYANTNIVKVLHNGPWFDHRVLNRYGMPIVRWEDTRDARMATSPTSPLSLGYLASIFDDTDNWKRGEEEEGESKGLVFTKNIGRLLRYCAQDCVETARVDAGICSEPEWNTPRVQHLYQVAKDLSVICAEMHTKGFLVHKLNREFLAWGLDQEYTEWNDLLLKKVKHPKFKGGPDQMRKLLFKRHETAELNRFHLDDPVDPALYTKTGQISVNFDALVQLLIDPFVPDEAKEIIKLYWKAESAWKSRSTFVVSEKVEHAIGRDGRLRPGWNNNGTDTGRFSCSEPNIMNIEQYLRAMYTCDEGWCIVHADKSQLELRMMHAVSGDEVLGEALKTGDVYAADAIGIFPQCKGLLPKDVKKMKPKARQAAKQVHLAFQYGAGTPKVYGQVLAEDFDAKFSDVAIIHDAMKKRYAGTVSYWHREHAQVCKNGYSETRLMMRRRAYPAEPPITETANYPIQGTAADVMNTEIIELRKVLRREVPSAFLIGQLHDAFDVQCRLQHRKRVEEIMGNVMSNPYSIGGRQYVFPVEIKVGTTWDEL